MNKKISFIGAGNMACAIIGGILNNNILNPQDITVFDILTEKLQEMKKLGLNTAKSAQQAVEAGEVIFLAVKPQNYADVLAEIKQTVTDEKIFVTIAAGISTAYINSALGASCPIVRVMPNTPMLIGKGAAAISRNEFIKDEDFKFIKNIFELAAVVEEFDEKFMNMIIAVNGSSPAYVYMFAKGMIDYAAQNGVDYKTAVSLVCASIKGSAEMIEKSDDDIDTLIKKVCSPGGTTIEAVNTLNSYSFCEGIEKAMESCTKRAEELGK